MPVDVMDKRCEENPSIWSGGGRQAAQIPPLKGKGRDTITTEAQNEAYE